MSTTVTTTVTTTTILQFGFALGLLLTVALIGLLVTKEMVTAGDGTRAMRWGRVLNVGIVPLMVAFVCLVAVKVMAAL